MLGRRSFEEKQEFKVAAVSSVALVSLPAIWIMDKSRVLRLQVSDTLNYRSDTRYH
jgi:hypothetical protein